MGWWSKALPSSTLHPIPSFPSSSTPLLSFLTNSSSSSKTWHSLSFPFKNCTVITLKNSSTYPLTSENPTPLLLSFSSTKFICNAAEYKFPDPIPEFADAETDKFRTHMLKKLSKKKDIYGDSIDEVVGICTEQTLGIGIRWTPKGEPPACCPYKGQSSSNCCAVCLLSSHRYLLQENT